MERKEAIKHLQAAKLMLLGPDNQPISDLYYALEVAIDSLEADETYQLEYEKVECEAEPSISKKILEGAIDKVEDYVCDHETDTAKAQGMCDALTMIEEYIREQSE